MKTIQKMKFLKCKGMNQDKLIATQSKIGMGVKARRRNEYT